MAFLSSRGKLRTTMTHEPAPLQQTDSTRNSETTVADLCYSNSVPIVNKKVGRAPGRLPHSDRNACITSTLAARTAGSADAITAAAKSTTIEPTTAAVSGIRISAK